MARSRCLAKDGMIWSLKAIVSRPRAIEQAIEHMKVDGQARPPGAFRSMSGGVVGFAACGDVLRPAQPFLILAGLRPYCSRTVRHAPALPAGRAQALRPTLMQLKTELFGADY